MINQLPDRDLNDSFVIQEKSTLRLASSTFFVVWITENFLYFSFTVL